MSLTFIRSLIASDFKVCRFCLQSSAQNLSDIFECIAGKAHIISINTTIRSSLELLGVQLTQNDAYPNQICDSCRDVLYSIQNFRDKASESVRLLDKARLLKEFPNVTFNDDVKEEKPTVEIVEPNLEVAYEVLVDNTTASDLPEEDGTKNELIDIQIYSASEDLDNKEDMKPINVALEENDYPETEWVEYGEETDEGGNHEEQTEEDAESVYFDEEYVEDGYEENQFVVEEVPDTEQLEVEVEMGEDDGGDRQMTIDETIERYKRKLATEKHLKTPKICPICGISSTAMLVHLRTHTKDKPYPCDICEKQFYTSTKLRTHIESVHVGEKKFTCDVCGKAFVLKKTLNAHMLSHMSEKGHVCAICSKGFLFRWALVKHQRTHTGEKPYICELDGCGKTFASSSNLRQHQKTSTHCPEKEREDVCPDCGKMYQSKYALRAHMKTHDQSRVKEKDS